MSYEDRPRYFYSHEEYMPLPTRLPKNQIGQGRYFEQLIHECIDRPDLPCPACEAVRIKKAG